MTNAPVDPRLVEFVRQRRQKATAQPVNPKLVDFVRQRRAAMKPQTPVEQPGLATVAKAGLASGTVGAVTGAARLGQSAASFIGAMPRYIDTAKAAVVGRGVQAVEDPIGTAFGVASVNPDVAALIEANVTAPDRGAEIAARQIAKPMKMAGDIGSAVEGGITAKAGARAQIPYTKEWFTFNAGQMVPQIAASIGLTTAGTVVGGPGVGLAAGFGSTFAMEGGDQAKSIYDAEIAKGTDPESAAVKAFMPSVVTGLINAGIEQMGIEALIRTGQLANGIRKSLASWFAGGVSEGVQEGLQGNTQRMYADTAWNPTSAENLSQTGQESVLGATMGMGSAVPAVAADTLGRPTRDPAPVRPVVRPVVRPPAPARPVVQSPTAQAAAARLRQQSAPSVTTTPVNPQPGAVPVTVTPTPVEESGPLIPPGQQPSEQDLAEARAIIMRDPTIATEPGRFRREVMAARARRGARPVAEYAYTDNPDLANVLGATQLGLTNIRTRRENANAAQRYESGGSAPGAVAVRGPDVPAAPTPAVQDRAVPPADQGRGVEGAAVEPAPASPVDRGVGKVVGDQRAEVRNQPGDVGVDADSKGLSTEALFERRHRLAKPIKGKSGASIVGYRWMSQLEEGPTRDRRVSDWSMSQTSEPTGRSIVHLYLVQDESGKETLMGIGAAQKALGISESRLQSIAKREAEAQRNRARQDDQTAATIEKNAATTPEAADAEYRRVNDPSKMMWGTPEERVRVIQDRFNAALVLTKRGRFIRTGDAALIDTLSSRGWSVYDGKDSTPTPPPAPAQKQPWEMTRGEYAKASAAPSGAVGVQLRGEILEGSRSPQEIEALQSLPQDIGSLSPENTTLLRKLQRDGLVTKRESRTGSRVSVTWEATDAGRTAVEAQTLTEAQALARYRDHRAAVARAVSEGKPVPAEVLADYPDLRSSQQQGTVAAANTTQEITNEEGNQEGRQEGLLNQQGQGANNAPNPDYAADIPERVAIAAHANTSHVPEKRGKQRRDEYAATLKSAREQLDAAAKTDEQKRIADAEFARYREGMKSRTLAYLNALSRTASSMITGPANFPVERNRKAGAVADKRGEELRDFDKRARAAMLRAVNAAATPEMRSNEETGRIEQITAKFIGRSRDGFNAMSKQNFVGKLERAAKNGETQAVARALQMLREEGQRRGKPLFVNRASIWKLADVATEAVQAEASAPTGEQEHAAYTDGTRVVRNYDDDRLRIFFPGKPSDAQRTTLKSRGFKWSPANGAWQRQNTQAAVFAADDILLGFGKQKNEAPPAAAAAAPTPTPAPAATAQAPTEAGVAERLDAIADRAKERLEKRAKKQRGSKTLNAGLNPEQLGTALRDTVDLSIVGAARGLAAGVRAGRALTKVVDAAIAEMGRTVTPKVRAIIQKNVRKILAESGGDPDKFEKVVSDLYNAPVTKKDIRAQAKARKQAAASITNPGENAAPVSQADALRGRLKAAEQTGEKVAKSAAAKIVQATRQGYQRGRRDERRTAIANMQGVVNDIKRERGRLRSLAQFEKRAGEVAVKMTADDARRAKMIRDGIRKQVVQYARTLPNEVRGRLVGRIATADTPVKMIKTVRALQRELMRHDGREAWGWIKKNARSTAVDKLKVVTNDLRKGVADLYAKAASAKRRIDAAKTLKDSSIALAELQNLQAEIELHITTASAAFKAIKGQRQQSAFQIATTAADIIAKRFAKRSGDGVSQIRDPKRWWVRKHLDSYNDLRNMLATLEGDNGPLFSAIWEALEEGSAEYSTLRRDKRAAMERAYVRAGFKDMADAIDSLSAFAGRGVEKKYTVTVGGESKTLSLGEISSLIAHNSDPETAALIASEHGMRFKSPEGIGNEGVIPTPNEIKDMAAAIEKDYKLAQLIDDLKAINEKDADRTLREVGELTGVQPKKVEKRWTRSRDMEMVPGMEDKPITTADPSMVNVIRSFAENMGIYEHRTQTTGIPILLKDVHSVMEEEIHKQAATLALARRVRDAMLILTQDQLGKAIINAKGVEFYRALKRQVMAAGRTEVVYATDAEKAVGFLKGSAAVKYLAANPSTYIGNLLGTLRVLPDVDARDYAAGIKAMTSMSRAELEQRSGYLWDRWEQQGMGRFGPSPESTMDARMTQAHTGFQAFLREIGRQVRNSMKNAGRGDLGAGLTNLRMGSAAFMQGLNWVESRIAAFTWGAMDAKVRREQPELSDKAREKVVEKFVRREVRETQNGGDPVDAASIATQNRSSAASIVMFLLSDVFKVRNRVKRAFRQSKSYGAKVLAAEAVGSLAKAYAVKYLWDAVSFWIAHALGGDDDKDRIVARMKDWTTPIERSAQDLFQILVPIGGPDLASLIDALRGRYNDQSKGGPVAMLAPLYDAGSAGLNAINVVAKSIENDDMNAEKIGLALAKFFDETTSAFGLNPLSPWTHRALREIVQTRKSEWW